MVEKDVMDGQSEDRRRMRSQGEGGVVKMDGCKTLPLEVLPNDKVGDILRQQTGHVRDMQRQRAE